jgi:hypothetical protein
MRRQAPLLLVVGLLLAADEDARPKTPKALRPPEGQKVLLRVRAKGVQLYECKARGDGAAQFEWALKAPEAELFDSKGKKIGKHYRTAAGPTWEAADGSKVVGEVMKSVPAPKPGDIPWLLLRAKSHQGDGLFSKVSYIRRLKTVGGPAPAEKPTRAQLGKIRRVKYKATYVFHVKQ